MLREPSQNLSSTKQIDMTERFKFFTMKQKRIYLIPASIFVLVIILASVIFNREKEDELIELKASVQFADKMFVITNNDTTDFVHADISIDNYYKIRDYNLQAGETYTIWQSEFLHHNGRHYPANRKPSQFSIWCETQNGKKGYYSKKIR